MGNDSHDALHEFVAGRYPDLRRSAFLMCGDWALAEELTQSSLARLVAETQRGIVDDPDAFAYADLMAAFQHRPARREHVFVAAPETVAGDDAAGIEGPTGGARGEGEERAGARREGEERAGGARGEREERAGGEVEEDGDEQIRTVLVLDALHRLAPRCRAVMVLRHWTGFAVDETADVLGLPDERVQAYEAAGLAALDKLLDTDAGIGVSLVDLDKPLDTGTDTDTDTDTDAGTGTDTDTGSDSGTDTDTDSGTDIDTGIGAAARGP